MDGRHNSNIYEVNLWLWQFGRGNPRLWGLTIEQTETRKEAVVDAQNNCAAETRRNSKTAPA